MSYREIKKTKSTQNKSIMNDVVTLAPEFIPLLIIPILQVQEEIDN